MKKELLYVSLALLGVVGILFVWSGTVLSAVPALDTVLNLLNPSTVLILSAMLLSVFVLVQVIEMRSENESDEEGDTDFSSLREVEGVGEDELEEFERDEGLSAVGEEFDIAVMKAVDTSLDEDQRRERRDWVREHLRETVAMRYSEVTGVGIEEAKDEVLSGGWTDDVRASGFLADKEGESVPLKIWLLDVLVGRDPFLKGVETTVDRIEELGGGA